MLRLNLMPWRERQRQAAIQRLRLMLVGAAVLALCAVLLMDQLARQRVRQHAMASHAQQVAIQALQAQLSEHERITQAYADVRNQVAALAGLRTQQGLPSAVFADLERAMPEGVRLRHVEMDGSQLRMAGIAASSAVVAQLMRELERSGVLRDLELKHIRQQPGGDEFLLLARVSAVWS